MRRATALLVVLALVACARTHPLTKKQAVDLIGSSQAFRSPIDPGIVFVDATFRPGPNTKRDLLQLEALSVKEDGPFGIAGKTATGAFTWRWTEGPFAGRVFRSKVKLNDNGDGWHVYDDYLKRELYSAERGEQE